MSARQRTPRAPFVRGCSLCGDDSPRLRHARATCPQRPDLPARDARKVQDERSSRLFEPAADFDELLVVGVDLCAHGSRLGCCDEWECQGMSVAQQRAP